MQGEDLCKQLCAHLDSDCDVVKGLQVQAELPVRAGGQLVAPALQRAGVVAHDQDEVISAQAIVQQLAHAWLPLEALQNGHLGENVHLRAKEAVSQWLEAGGCSTAVRLGAQVLLGSRYGAIKGISKVYQS